MNAIVHRDYSISGSTLISIFDDRIEFVTIGGLVRGISFDDLMLGVSILRNRHLANVFYRLRLIEAYGTGMLKINECYNEFEVKPKIEVTNNAFKITLPNTNYRGDRTIVKEVKSTVPCIEAFKERRDEIVVRLFEKQETITRKDIETALNVSQSTAILIVRELVDRGVLIKEGNGKFRSYRLGKI